MHLYYCTFRVPLVSPGGNILQNASTITRFDFQQNTCNQSVPWSAPSHSLEVLCFLYVVFWFQHLDGIHQSNSDFHSFTCTHACVCVCEVLKSQIWLSSSSSCSSVCISHFVRVLSFVGSCIHHHSQGTQPEEFLLLLLSSHTSLPSLFLILPGGLVTALAHVINADTLWKMNIYYI